ncbi:hypothetical protein J2046_002856 [Rhizobium petrolearium]|uniref:hypothetical protein n=1 Tax=Neorhizobium petrolearium TaxID=515361 RepID=UPI001AE43B46|nr:hypothetical protein [Neorhizobium petrolearium]MBP1844597.1 hypothetical protein [Neorhizobium petrolearium]
MKTINDWLDDKYEEMATSPEFSNKLSDFEQQAAILRDQAKAEGYSTKDLSEECGGNIAAHLMNRVNTRNRAEIRRKVEKNLTE